MTTSLLQLMNISACYKQKPVFANVSFNLRAGEILCLLGPNGAGKSTLSKIISGIQKASSGEARLKNRPIQNFTRRELARNLVYIPQNPLRPNGLTLRETVMQGRFPHLPFTGFYSSEDKKITEEALAKTDLIHLENRKVESLSGGEWQRALISRAICQASGAQNPVLVLDEIISGLDPLRSIKIFTLLASLRQTGYAIIAAVHDCNIAAMFACRLLALKAGRILFYGKTKDVFNAENLSKLYDMEMDTFVHPDLGCSQVFPRFANNSNTCHAVPG